jgi:hypothetical protein
VLWVDKVAKMSYRWKVGNGQKIRSEAFRRCVDLSLFNLWDVVVRLVADINLTHDEDSLNFQFQL